MPPRARKQPKLRPLVVALIGPAGAGKSALREALARRGAVTVDFDDYSRVLLRPGTPEYERLQREFGSQVFREDGSVDRAALAAQVFSDAKARRRLNAILHPGMLRLLRQAVEDYRDTPAAPVLIVEGAILGQLPTTDLFDRIVLVTAPPQIRLQRLCEGKGLSEQQAQRLLRLHEEIGVGQEKVDGVVTNVGDRAALEAQAEALWEELTR